MKRRRFLEASAVGLVAAGWPAFIREAFAASPEPSCSEDEAPTDSTSSCEALLDAHRHARAAGRPLLVLVIPEDSRQRNSRGSLFGSHINWGDDAALATLGLCVVVCASMAHIRRLGSETKSIEGEPLAVLVETDAQPVARSIDGRIAGWEQAFDGDSRALDRAQAALSRLLRTSIGADPERAAQLRSPGRVAELARQARERLKEQRVPGSKWASSTGCGDEIELLPGEQDTSLMMLCGMGHVPEKARRMLYFWSHPREPRAS